MDEIDFDNNVELPDDPQKQLAALNEKDRYGQDHALFINTKRVVTATLGGSLATTTGAYTIQQILSTQGDFKCDDRKSFTDNARSISATAIDCLTLIALGLTVLSQALLGMSVKKQRADIDIDRYVLGLNYPDLFDGPQFLDPKTPDRFEDETNKHFKNYRKPF